MLKKIPRAENRKEDELARMTSAFTSWEVEDPLVQVEFIAQVDHMPQTCVDW